MSLGCRDGGSRFDFCGRSEVDAGEKAGATRRPPMALRLGKQFTPGSTETHPRAGNEGGKSVRDVPGVQMGRFLPLINLIVRRHDEERNRLEKKRVSQEIHEVGERMGHPSRGVATVKDGLERQGP